MGEIKGKKEAKLGRVCGRGGKVGRACYGKLLWHDRPLQLQLPTHLSLFTLLKCVNKAFEDFCGRLLVSIQETVTNEVETNLG